MENNVRELEPITFLVSDSQFRNHHSETGDPEKSSASRRVVDDESLSAEGMCLVLLAHGSKDPRWCAPFERITQELQKELGVQRVRLAYMEFMAPTLMDVAHECVQQLTLNLRLAPLFMAVGAHLATDIPEQVALVRRKFPQITVEVLPPIGEDARVMRLVEQIAIEAANQ
jgi:sirohydrochlorin cobaltochelatase